MGNSPDAKSSTHHDRMCVLSPATSCHYQLNAWKCWAWTIASSASLNPHLKFIILPRVICSLPKKCSNDIVFFLIYNSCIWRIDSLLVPRPVKAFSCPTAKPWFLPAAPLSSHPQGHKKLPISYKAQRLPFSLQAASDWTGNPLSPHISPSTYPPCGFMSSVKHPFLCALTWAEQPQPLVDAYVQVLNALEPQNSS